MSRSPLDLYVFKKGPLINNNNHKYFIIHYKNETWFVHFHIITSHQQKDKHIHTHRTYTQESGTQETRRVHST